MQLRPYQEQAKQDIYNAWNSGASNVLSVLPTGAGKTVLFSEIIKEHQGASCAIAHRQELVSQISLALARDNVRHRIIGPQSVVRMIVNLHMSELRKSFYDPSAHCGVAGVDTLVRRQVELAPWLKSNTLWVQDEAHHVLINNKWGTAASKFPNAKGLGVTATPGRADGKGLGRHADGLFDVMVNGPSMRDLIDMDYLTDYRIFAPPSDLDLNNVPTGSGGEFSPAPLKLAVRKSHVIGDVVKHYLRIAPGKLGITFATDVETATDIAAQFNLAGVPAAVVHAKTPDADRIAILRRFKNRELLQLVNVDLFGEGFDLPAIEVVSMARPTQSYGLYVQQFGRCLRLLAGKLYGIIIDHVGNVERHGLPDAPRTWSLDRREKRSKGAPDDVIPVKSCPECTAVYERIHNACPYCGHIAPPAARSGPEFVDGDLHELDAETLANMRGEINRVDGPVRYPNSLHNAAKTHLMNSHYNRQDVQKALRASMAWWAGFQLNMGRSNSESYKRFYWMFGVDVMTAQTLNSRDALALAEKVNLKLVELMP